MSGDDAVMAWLQSQPLDRPIEIDGESVYLKVGPEGAELGACLFRGYTPEQLRLALMQGFDSAIDYDAGLGQSEDGRDLVLSQWLPGVWSWPQAADALEKLLNQIAAWRALLSLDVRPRAITTNDRTEQRLRMLYGGGKHERVDI